MILLFTVTLTSHHIHIHMHPPAFHHDFGYNWKWSLHLTIREGSAARNTLEYYIITPCGRGYVAVLFWLHSWGNELLLAMHHGWLKLGNMSNRGNSSRPLLSDVPEDGISPSPPGVSPMGSPNSWGSRDARRRDELSKSMQSPTSTQPSDDVVVKVLGNRE